MDSCADTFHCKMPHKLPVNQIDPSMALAFLCKNADDLTSFYELAQSLQEHGNPLFEVIDNLPPDQVVRSKDIKFALSSSD